MAPTVRGRKTQEIVSLTLEPTVIGLFFFNLICDLSRRLLHPSKIQQSGYRNSDMFSMFLSVKIPSREPEKKYCGNNLDLLEDELIAMFA